MVPFVGPSYELRTKRNSPQRAINLMPTKIESGMGKAAMYLKPVPGLVLFDGDTVIPEEPGGGGGVASLFMAEFVSHSCNYGFFPRTSGGWLLVTDGVVKEATTQLYPLKLVNVSAAGAVVSETEYAEYVSLGAMTTYWHDGSVYVGPVVKVATGKRHLLRVDPDTQAIDVVFENNTDLWFTFIPLADPSRVLINTLAGITFVTATVLNKVVSLVDGSVVHSVNLPFYLAGDNALHQTAQSAVSSKFYVCSIANNRVYECAYADGAVLAEHDVETLFGAGHFECRVYLVDQSVVLLARDGSGAGLASSIGVFDESSAVDGIGSFSGHVTRYDEMLFDAARNTFYFVSTETGVESRVRGYDLTSGTLDFSQALDLGVSAAAIESGTGGFTGWVSGFDLYLSVFKRFVTAGDGTMEGYVVFKITPP